MIIDGLCTSLASNKSLLFYTMAYLEYATAHIGLTFISYFAEGDVTPCFQCDFRRFCKSLP